MAYSRNSFLRTNILIGILFYHMHTFSLTNLGFFICFSHRNFYFILCTIQFTTLKVIGFSLFIILIFLQKIKFLLFFIYMIFVVFSFLNNEYC